MVSSSLVNSQNINRGQFFQKVALPVVAYFSLFGCGVNQPYKIKNITTADIRKIHTEGPTLVHRSLQRERNFNFEVGKQHYEEFQDLAFEAKYRLNILGLLNKKKYSIDEAKQILEIFGEVIDSKYPFPKDKKQIYSISEGFDKDLAVCFQKVFLYMSLNESILNNALPLSLFLAPGHISMRYQEPGVEPREYDVNYFNWETTIRRKDKSKHDSTLKKKLSITQGEITRGNYFKDLTDKEALSVHLVMLGGVYDDKGVREKAIDFYTLALHVNPKNIEALNNRAVALIKLACYDLALKDCNEAIKINPEYETIYNNRANIKSYRHDYLAAIEDYSISISLNPEVASTYYNRGVIYLKLGKKNLARRDFKEAIALSPSNKLYKRALKSIDASVPQRIFRFFGLN